MRPSAGLLAILTLALTTAVTGCGEDVASFAPGAAPTDDASGEELAEADAAIVDGSVDEGHPAVVALTFQGKAFCSGTLVAPTVVVTAAHCLHRDFVGALPITEVDVFFGTDVAGAGTSIDVVEARLHPDFRSDDPEQDDDVALVRLAVEAPVAPMPMAFTPEKGTRVTLVGFGRPGADVDETGVKRIGSSKIKQVTPRLFVMKGDPHGTCKGDSGGTTIATIDGVETFVGIHTRSDCKTGMIEERVDAHFEGFIRPFLGEATCLGCGEENVVRDRPADGDADELDESEVADDATDGAADEGNIYGCTVGPAAPGGLAPALLAVATSLVAAARRRRAR